MFLIAVVSIVDGMGRYMEEEFAGKLMGVNTFTLRHRPYFDDAHDRRGVERRTSGGRASTCTTWSRW